METHLQSAYELLTLKLVFNPERIVKEDVVTYFLFDFHDSPECLCHIQL